MARKINKNKSKTFGILFSILIIIALVVMVPLSISSIRENLDTRNQAYKGSAPTIPNEDFLYINTSTAANYLDTRWESANFQLQKDVSYSLQTAFIPYNLVDGPAAGDKDSGLHIAIVCAETDGKCAGKTPGSEINVNEFLVEIPVPKTNVPENKLGTYMFRNLKPFKMPANGTYRIHIFANNGTEVAINHVRVRAQNSTDNIVTNGDFELKEDYAVSRDYPNQWQEDSVNSNEYVVRTNNGVMVIRGRYSPGAQFPVGQNSTTHNNAFYTVFSVPEGGNGYSVIAKARMTKKRPGPNTPTADVKVIDITPGTNPQTVYTKMLTNSDNNIDEAVSNLQPLRTYKLVFQSTKGTEWEVDTLGIKKAGQPSDNQNSYISVDALMTQSATYQARTFQPSDWTAAPNNRNFGYSHVAKPDRGPIGAPFANGSPPVPPQAPPTAECLTAEIESNNSGPLAFPLPRLCENMQIAGRFNTAQDTGENARGDLYFLPDVPANRSIQINLANLRNHTFVSVMKYVSNQTPNSIIFETSTDQNKTITFETESVQRYAIWLWKEEGSSTEPYTLKWQYTN